MILLRAVPPELVQGVASGIYTITAPSSVTLPRGAALAFYKKQEFFKHFLETS